ncbi:MAG: hypothetical protein ACLTE2_08595 [Eubacteriales bacterium]
MKTLFVAINAKYIHTNLAVRYMHELAKQNGYTSTELLNILSISTHASVIA